MQKEQWRVKNGFSVSQTQDGQHVWEQAQVGTDAGAEPYVLDLKTLGQRGIARNEHPKTQLAKNKPFNAMIPADNFRNEFVLTNSIRSGRSIEAEIEQLRALNITIDNMTLNSTENAMDI